MLKQFVKKFFQFFGYNLIAYPRFMDLSSYEQILPNASYAPWKKDPIFLETYEKIKFNTLVDLFRCYELWSLIEQSAKLQGSIIEIGVWRGGTGAIIAQKAALCHISDPVYLCDTFEGVVKASDKDVSYKGKEHSDTSFSIVQSLLQRMQLQNVTLLQGIFPDETAKLISGGSFRFCHIDVDVYESAKDIVDWIWPRMTRGGIIVYDDYGFDTCQGITTFVNEQKKRSDCLFLHNLNGHAVFIKR